MNSKLAALLKTYNDLPDVHRQIIDCLSIKFSGTDKSGGLRYLQTLINPKILIKTYDLYLKELVLQRIVKFIDNRYDLPSELKFELFPKLIQQKKYIEFIEEEQSIDKYYSWNIPFTESLRDFLFASFVEENEYTKKATTNIFGNLSKAIPYFYLMLANPNYNKALKHSPLLLFRIMLSIQTNNTINFHGFETTMQFFERNKDFKGVFHHVDIHKSEIIFHRGQLLEAEELVKTINNNESLLLKGQISLFRGDFEKSEAFFDEARFTNEEGLKMLRVELSYFHEFFYWLNFLFNPTGLNIKKLDSFIKKAEKGNNNHYANLLPLLYILKKDQVTAESKIETLNLIDLNFTSLMQLLMYYIIHGNLKKELNTIAYLIGEKLITNGQLLFLRELTFVMEKSGINTEQQTSLLKSLPNDFPCLMSRVNHQEKWELTLDGLMNLITGKSVSANYAEKTVRICYMCNVENGYIQPILQTYTAKGGWSAGRNIAMKRLKEQQVEGMTEQDRRIAATINYNSGYYVSEEYYFVTEKTLVELCGHPLLFLNSNQTVSFELIKSQPELITEETKNGIRLKTNITKTDEKNILIKETQTRFKLIPLSPEQQKVIALVNKGITIPAKGKEKLLQIVSHLSSIMTVHSDLADSTASSKTIDADSRVRVQIIPFGDGLKAEMFVKPLSSQPPYTKPGKGGKVVYGTIDGQKCQTIRNMASELTNADTINNSISTTLDCDLIEEAVTFSDPYQCLELLETLAQHSEIAIVEWPEGEHFRLKKYASFANLHLSIKGRGQWFELEGELNIDEATILSLKELLDISRKSKGRFLELKKGEFLALTEELKRQIDELEAYTTINKNGITINRFASHALEELTSKAASFKTDKLWKDFQKKIKSTTNIDAQIPATLDAELRPYQEEGFRWLTRLKMWDAGACLADDMGLGKTVQAIAMMLHLAENGPILVVCPASVVPNWGSELRKFAPTLNQYILKPGNREETFTSLAAFDVLVITYGLLQTEEERIVKTQWAMAVLDEAHAIKNTQTKSSKAAMNIQSDFKLALTGTPIQNHLGELWNLFNFCNPGLLGTLPQFTDRYLKNETNTQKNHLKKLISPFILRRTKNKVLDELPPKTEITFSVDLSDAEMAFYETLRREAIATIENNNGPGGHQHLQALAEITKLRLACCNSALVNKAIQLPSAKLDAFFEIIEELRANKHRALVFSQFVGHLSIVRQALDNQGITYQYLDGSTSIPNREVAVKAFQSGKGDLFLISLKAGGLGLNLTAADYVLHLDPWWNPAVEDQASDRAHRIGQTRPVTIYRLVAKNTIEEKILQLHATKRDMADSLLDGTDQSARLSTSDLLNLLKEV